MDNEKLNLIKETQKEEISEFKKLELKNKNKRYKFDHNYNKCKVTSIIILLLFGMITFCILFIYELENSKKLKKTIE